MIEYTIIPVKIILRNAVLESIRFELERLTPLIRRTIMIAIARMVIETNAIATVIKNDFKTR